MPDFPTRPPAKLLMLPGSALVTILAVLALIALVVWLAVTSPRW
jgi:hypothetical protein